MAAGDTAEGGGAVKLTGKAAEIDAKIKEAGDKVRELKTAKADKAAIDAAVKVLLENKECLKGGDRSGLETGGSTAVAGEEGRRTRVLRRRGRRGGEVGPVEEA